MRVGIKASEQKMAWKTDPSQMAKGLQKGLRRQAIAAKEETI
jgi:hypothetical protein